jgi:hypothetical protein
MLVGRQNCVCERNSATTEDEKGLARVFWLPSKDGAASPGCVRLPTRLFPSTSSDRLGKRCPPTAVGRIQMKTTATEAAEEGSPLLGLTAPALVGLGEALLVVKPETVICWHRAGFRLFWRWRSRIRPPGRPRISAELRSLIRQMKTENPTWGAPRIHGELLKLGFEISEPIVPRYLRQLKHCGGAAKCPSRKRYRRIKSTSCLL